VAVLSVEGAADDSPRFIQGSRTDFDAWWTLAVAFALLLVSYLDRSIVSMIVPEIKAGLSLSDFQMGLILGPAFAVFFSLFAIPLGWASDRYSRRWVISFGVAVFGVATIVSGFATSFLFLLLTRMLVATGEAAITPASVSLISEKFPRKLLTTALSIYSTGLKVGGAAALALGAVAIVYATKVTHLIPQLAGVQPWRLVFALTGLPALLLAGLVFTFREGEHPKHRAAPDAPSVTAAKFLADEWRLFVPMVLGFSLVAICGQALISWTPAYFHRAFGWKPAQFGPLLGTIGLVSAATLVFKGAAMDWFYARGVKDIYVRFYVWILIASLPFVAAVFLVKGVWLFVALYAVVAIVTIPFLSYASVAVQTIAPPMLRGRLAAFIGIPMTLAGGLGPMLVGAITDYGLHDEKKLGLSMAIVFCAMIPAALVSFTICLRPLRRAVVNAEARETAARAAAEATQHVGA
jgi:MFS family permease